MLGNTAERWGWLAKAFHWVTALMILVLVPVGMVMSRTYAFKFDNKQLESIHVAMSVIHQSLGLIVLILVVARLGWRLRNPVPGLPAGLAAYQRVLAKLNHAVLYALLFIVPLSGWASLSAFGEAPTYFLWWEGLPEIVPKVPLDHPFGYSFYAGIHIWALWTGLGVLALHVIAALWHEFARKDSVLRRMWPLAG